MKRLLPLLILPILAFCQGPSSNDKEGLSIFFVTGFQGYKLIDLKDYSNKADFTISEQDIKSWNWSTGSFELKKSKEKEMKKVGGSAVFYVYLNGKELFRGMYLNKISQMGMDRSVPAMHDEADWSERKKALNFRIVPFHRPDLSMIAEAPDFLKQGPQFDQDELERIRPQVLKEFLRSKSLLIEKVEAKSPRP